MSEYKFIDQIGLSVFWNKIKSTFIDENELETAVNIIDSAKQNKLTSGTNITIDSNNKISAIPVLANDLTASVNIGQVTAGTTFTAGTSIESILIQLFSQSEVPSGTKYIYYGVVDSIPTNVDGLTKKIATKDDLLANGYTWRNITTNNQYAIFGIDKSLGIQLDEMQQSGFSLEFTTVELNNQYLFYVDNKSTDTNTKIIYTFYEG